jgi:hypothetical protein
MIRAPDLVHALYLSLDVVEINDFDVGSNHDLEQIIYVCFKSLCYPSNQELKCWIASCKKKSVLKVLGSRILAVAVIVHF